MRTADAHGITAWSASVRRRNETHHANGLRTQDCWLRRSGNRERLQRRARDQFVHGIVEWIPNNLVTDKESSNTMRRLLSNLYVIIMKPLSQQLQVTKGHPEAERISKESPLRTLHGDTDLLYTPRVADSLYQVTKGS